jgi:hypothetical protein
VGFAIEVVGGGGWDDHDLGWFGAVRLVVSGAMVLVGFFLWIAVLEALGFDMSSDEG